MMSEKMKKFPLDPLSYGVYEEAKIRFKHQSLFQDYQELQKEVEARRDRLDIVKQQILILLDEVRFLRRRRKYLLNKSTNFSQDHHLVLPQKETLLKSNMKNQICGKGSALCKLPPPNHVACQKRKVHARKKAARRNVSPMSAVNHKKGLHSGKAVSLQKVAPVADLKHRMSQGIDLNQKERTQAGKESESRSRAPTFDLNEISIDVEFQNNYKAWRNDELKNGLTRDGIDEQQLNDLKLPICRNIGDGSSRMGKRKISWQDPVAVRV